MKLAAEKIHCLRNNRSLFCNIDFSIEAGQLLQVVGNNGVGKSSLLRIVAGLLMPESGAIFWNNQLAAQSDFHQHVFYLGHSLANKLAFTIKENILYSAHDYSSIEKIKTILQSWSLDYASNQLCGELSQGQQQRIALARLQLSDKKIWILDEPFSNLDAQGILQLEQLLQSHLKNNGIILMSTHREININSRFLLLK